MKPLIILGLWAASVGWGQSVSNNKTGIDLTVPSMPINTILVGDKQLQIATTWHFTIDGHEYKLTGSQLAEAVKAQQMAYGKISGTATTASPPNCSVDPSVWFPCKNYYYGCRPDIVCDGGSIACSDSQHCPPVTNPEAERQAILKRVEALEKRLEVLCRSLSFSQDFCSAPKAKEGK